MNMQSNEKTSTKRANSSSSVPQKRKKNNINTCSASRSILPNSQQKVSQAPLQLQQQNILQVPQFQQQSILPQLQQQGVFSEQYISQHYEIDPQLYSLPSNRSEIKENYDENVLLVSL